MGLNFHFLDDPSFRFLKDKVYEDKFSLSYLNDSFTELDRWKSEARQYINARLSYAPPEVPFNEEIVKEEDFGAYIRQKIYFDSAPGCRIPAYLLIPKNLRKPAPAVIVQHDHGGMLYWGKEKVVEHHRAHEVLESFIDTCYEGQPPASELAKRGYVTLVIDSLFFGERKFQLEAVPDFKQRLDQYEFESAAYIDEYNEMESRIVEAEISKGFYYAGWTCAGVRIRDDIASVSFLCSRPEVDAEKIGSIGLSMGGHRTAWLSALDDRVKCAVVVCWMARHREMIEHKISNIHWMWNVPDLHHAMDYPDVVSLSAPKPLMVMHGTKDPLFPLETGQKGLDIVRHVYEKAGSETNFSPKLYNTIHEFNIQMQSDAYSWLDEKLKI